MSVHPNGNDKSNPELDFLEVKISMPAKRALRNAGIGSLEMLAKFSEKELLKLHGLGKTTLPKLKKALQQNNLKLRK